MAELWFIGLGLGDERDVSRRALERIASSEKIYAEEYTATWTPGAFDRLAKEVGRPIELLTREQVESEAPILAALQRAERVAFLTVGDPFAATTHVALRLAVEREGHSTHYLPSASILSAAAGVLGLIPYRFGRTVSLPFPEPDFRPTSPLEAIARNRGAGLHTLLLLDLRPAERRFMTASEALDLLRSMDSDGRVVPGDLTVAVVARVGRADERAHVGRIDELRARDFGPPMHAVVIPAPELHFEEAESLERLARRTRS